MQQRSAWALVVVLTLGFLFAWGIFGSSPTLRESGAEPAQTGTEQAALEPPAPKRFDGQGSGGRVGRERQSEPDGAPSATSPADDLPVGYAYPTDRAFTLDDWQLLVPLEGRVPLSEDELRSKYPEQRSHEEWLGLAATAGARMSNEVLRIASSLSAAGSFELVRVPLNDAGEPLKKWMGATSDELPLFSLSGGSGTPPGFAQITWIPWDRYPELYDLRDEWVFLNEQAQAAK